MKNSLTKDAKVVSAGLGHDVSFDLSLIEKYGCRVVGYDPDAKAIACHDHSKFPPEFGWRCFGIGAERGVLKLYHPLREDHISGTIVQGAIRHGEKYDEVPIVGIKEVIDEFGTLDVLKMDVEGAEYQIIEAMVASGIGTNQIGQLLIEFHHGMGVFKGSDTSRAVGLLRGLGFVPFWVSEGGHEFGFASRRLLD